MTEINISKRLKKIAEYLPEGAVFADIGSDHAYLPCYVCMYDQQAKAIAGEINEGPFQSALDQVSKWQLHDRIEVRLGDGLQVIKLNEVNQVVIAGMGGTLITSILNNGKEKLTSVNKIIAQPNINARQVRKWFYQNNYELIDEYIMDEDGYYYEILVAQKMEKPCNEPSEKEFYLGPIILKNKNLAFQNKWNNVLRKKQKIVEQMKNAEEPDFIKVSQFEKEIKWLEEELGT